MALLNTSFSCEEIHNFFVKAKKIFFIGIGGISTSSLATYAYFCGKEIYGYDQVRGSEARKLESIAKIKYYSTPDNVENMDLVVYTGAIDENNFEYKRAMELEIPTVSRANFLGYVISRYKNQIGICGMHGKSTTTAMLWKIFSYASRRPSVFCGAEISELKSSSVLDSGESCIFEACEYLNSFLSLRARDVGIVNIDYDHPDFFKSIDEVIESFNAFVLPSERVFINADDLYSKKIKHKKIITYGIKNEATYRGKIIHSVGKNEFLVYHGKKELGKVRLKMCGVHFVYDALCAIAIACENKISPRVVFSALEEFEGTLRRLQMIKKTDTGVPIFEDYAHHPTEIKATIEALISSGYKKITCLFQAHTYSRTFYLYDGFKKAFDGVCSLFVLPIYPAREKNTLGLTDEGFASDIGGVFVSSIENARKLLFSCEADVIVIMGAGDITNIKKIL